MSWDGRSAGKLPRMDWYPADYLADPKVLAMPIEAEGPYLRLLFIEWLDGPLPADHATLARLVKMTPEAFEAIWPELAACFEESDGRLQNPRLERERKLALRVREAKRASGRASAMARRKKTKNERATNRQRKANPSPSPSPSPSLLPSEDSGEKEERPLEDSGSGVAPPATTPTRTRKRAAPSPQEAAVKALRQRIGCGLNPARDQVRALRAAGMSIEEIHRAIDLHGRPGLAPWTWTARVTGTRNDPRGGMSAAEILAYGRQDNGSPAKENP